MLEFYLLAIHRLLPDFDFAYLGLQYQINHPKHPIDHLVRQQLNRYPYNNF